MVRHIYTSLDIGTDSTKVVVCELYRGKLNLLAASSIKSRGIKKGLITDVNEASLTIRSVIDDVSQMLGFKIKKVLVNIPSYFSEFVKIEGSIKIDSDDLVICGEHVSNVLDVALKNSSFSKEIVSVIPIDFTVDEKSGIKDPKGIMGNVLGVRAVACLTPKKNIYSVVSLLDNIGLEVVDISLNGIGDINAFKNKDIESKLGAIINIGYETTNISVYNKGIIIKNSVICMGGKNIDNDIAYMYKIDTNEASKIKEKFALAYKGNASLNEFYEISDDLRINQFEVSDIVMARIEEILSLAKKEINLLANSKMDYVIVTGGISNMEQFKNIASQVLGSDVIIGNVNIIGIRNNKYSSCIGNIVYFINKLKLSNNVYSMVDEGDSEVLSYSRRSLLDVSNESMLGRVFGYFFGESNEEEL